jgi:DNA repair protein RadC
MSTIADWPATERPRERLFAHGAAALTDAELIAVVLGAGNGRASALEVARDLLGRHRNLSGLFGTPVTKLASLPHEAFVVLFLDSQHRLLAADELFRGTLAQTSVYPREVVKAALARNAAAVIFAHNHPSGVAEPSRADELLTQALKQALALVDIRTLDHFVVAGHMAAHLRVQPRSRARRMRVIAIRCRQLCCLQEARFP